MSASELANAIERICGVDAAACAEERFRAMEKAGDQASLDRFKAVAETRVALRHAPHATIKATFAPTN